MRQIRLKFGLTILFSFLMFTNVDASPKIFQSTPSVAKICAGRTISVTLPFPPEGMVTIKNVSLDHTCNLIFDAIRFVPLAEAPHIPATGINTERITGDSISVNNNIYRTHYADQGVYDPVGLLLNRLTTYTNFSYDGTSIGRLGVYGEAFGQTTILTCGFPGWRTRNTYARITKGGGGFASATLRHHSEYSYQGCFDTSGRLYYNTLDSYINVRGDGSGSCTFIHQYRRLYCLTGNSLCWVWDFTCQ